MIATWVKKHRRAERFASCFGIFLMRFPPSRMIMLPRVWVYSNGTAAASRFSNNGTFPAFLACWHNHCHHLHVNVAWRGGVGGWGGGGAISWEASNCPRPPSRCDLGPEPHVRMCWQSGRYPVEASWKAESSCTRTTGIRRIAFASLRQGGKQKPGKKSPASQAAKEAILGGRTEGQHLNRHK